MYQNPRQNIYQDLYKNSAPQKESEQEIFKSESTGLSYNSEKKRFFIVATSILFLMIAWFVGPLLNSFLFFNSLSSDFISFYFLMGFCFLSFCIVALFNYFRIIRRKTIAFIWFVVSFFGIVYFLFANLNDDLGIAAAGAFLCCGFFIALIVAFLFIFWVFGKLSSLKYFKAIIIVIALMAFLPSIRTLWFSSKSDIPLKIDKDSAIIIKAMRSKNINLCKDSGYEKQCEKTVNLILQDNFFCSAEFRKYGSARVDVEEYLDFRKCSGQTQEEPPHDLFIRNAENISDCEKIASEERDKFADADLEFIVESDLHKCLTLVKKDSSLCQQGPRVYKDISGCYNNFAIKFQDTKYCDQMGGYTTGEIVGRTGECYILVELAKNGVVH